MPSSLDRRPTQRLAAAWFLRATVLAAVGVALFLDTNNLRPGTGAPDPVTVTRYAVVMDLGADGTLRTVETVEVEVPTGRRGIFRVFDEAPRSGEGPDRPVTDVEVTRDGAPEPFTEVASPKGTSTIRIGDPDVFLEPGRHVYTIASTTTGALEPGPGGAPVWWWDVVGSGWQMRMEQVEVQVLLPAEPVLVECVEGDVTPCSPEIDRRTLVLRTGPLSPFTPVTLRTTFPTGAVTPTGTPAPWRRWVLPGLAVLGGAVVSLVVWRSTRERTPGMPVLFEPPAGVTPAVGVRVVDEAPGGNELQATLFDLAERGVLRVDEADGTWTVTAVADPGTLVTSPVERAVLDELQVGAVGDSFTVDRTPTAGQRVAAARKALDRAVDAEATPYLQRSGAGRLARVLAWGGTICVAVVAGMHLAVNGHVANATVVCGAAALALGLLGTALDPRTASVHTDTGRDAWTRVGGFARFLSTESSETRFDAAAHLDWFPRYLPWAVAFGVGEEWARRYQAQGVELPSSAVPWLYSPGGVTHWGGSSMTSGFDAAISAAAASYAASQASSGGGFSGGFSGGSGGGGGGGGSW